MGERKQDGLIGKRKTQGNWVAEIGGQVPRIEVAGDICLWRPRPTQGCRADDGDSSLVLCISSPAVQYPYICLWRPRLTQGCRADDGDSSLVLCISSPAVQYPYPKMNKGTYRLQLPFSIRGAWKGTRTHGWKGTRTHGF